MNRKILSLAIGLALLQGASKAAATTFPPSSTTPPWGSTTPPWDSTTPPWSSTTPPWDGSTPPWSGTTPLWGTETLPDDFWLTDVWPDSLIDPDTGLWIDPETGLLINAVTGNLIDPLSGLQIDPITGLAIDPDTGFVTDANGHIIEPITGWIVDPSTGGFIDPVTGQAIDLSQLDPDALLTALNNTSLNAADFNKIEQTLDSLFNGWDIDPQTGELYPPPGEDLNLPFKLLEDAGNPNIEIAIGDWDKGMAVGGSIKAGSVIDELNKALEFAGFKECLFNQEEDDGMLHVFCTFSGEIIEFSFFPDEAVQAGKNAVSGLSTDAGGDYVLTTLKKRRFTVVGAPYDMGDFLTLLGAGGSLRMDKEGVLRIVSQEDDGTGTRARTERTRYVRADASVRQNSGGAPVVPGVTFSSPTEGQVTYANGTSQTVYATVPLPSVFQQQARAFPGVSSVIYTRKGSFNVVFQGKSITLVPRFDDIQVRLLNAGETVAPSITPNGDKLLYTVQDGNKAVTVMLSIQ